MKQRDKETKHDTKTKKTSKNSSRKNLFDLSELRVMLRFAIQAILIARGASIELVRQGHVAVFDGKIWVHGGWTQSRETISVLVFDEKT